MYFSDTDVVVRLEVNIADAGETGTAMEACEPLIEQFGVVSLQAEPADPGDDQRGYNVALMFVFPPEKELTTKQSMLRAVRPLLAEFGLKDKKFSISRVEGRGAVGILTDPEFFLPSWGLTVHSLTGRTGGDMAREYGEIRIEGEGGAVVASGGRRMRFTFLPCAETDIVSRVHVRLAAAELSSAMRLLALGTADPKPVAVEVMPEVSSEGCSGYSAALLTVMQPSGIRSSGQFSTEQAVEHTICSLARQLSLREESISLHTTKNETIGVLEGAPEVSSVSGAPREVVALYSRAGGDPFGAVDPYACFEFKELVPDDSPALNEEDILAIRNEVELASMVQVGLVADVICTDTAEAREAARGIAQRIRREISVGSGDIILGEPEEAGGGLLWVGAFVATTDLEPVTALEAVTSVIAGGEWKCREDLSENTGDAAAEWYANSIPESGLVRLEAHAARGLGK